VGEGRRGSPFPPFTLKGGMGEKNEEGEGTLPFLHLFLQLWGKKNPGEEEREGKGSLELEECREKR